MCTLNFKVKNYFLFHFINFKLKENLTNILITKITKNIKKLKIMNRIKTMALVRSF